MDDKEFLLSLTNFDSTFRRYDQLKKNRFVPSSEDYHKFLRQITEYYYLLSNSNDYTSEELINILNQTRQQSPPPVSNTTLINTFRWATNKISSLITSLRQKFVKGISIFLDKVCSSGDDDLFNYFSIVTFPSIFCYFADQEYERLGYLFIKMLMEKLPSEQYEPFINSFLLETTEFQSCLWDLFDEYASRTVTQNSSSQYFYPLLTALTKASSLLTFFQVKLLLKYHAKDPQSFISFFISKFLLDSYNIYHSSKITLQNEINPIEDFASYLDTIEKSPHSDLILSVLQSITKFRQLPPHELFAGIGDYPLFLSIKDIYIIQSIMMSLPGDKDFQISETFLIREEMKERGIPVSSTILLFSNRNKNDYKYLFSDKKDHNNEIIKKQIDMFFESNNSYLSLVNVKEFPTDPKNEKYEELNTRIKLVASDNGFSGSLSFIKSDRQGSPSARREKEKLVKNFDENSMKYIEGINLSNSTKKLKNIDTKFVTDLFYFDEVQKLLSKITKHLTKVLYHLLGSLYHSDRPTIDPLLTESLEMRALQTSAIIQAETQSWAVLRHKDCFNYYDFADNDDFARSGFFQTLNGRLNRPAKQKRNKSVRSETIKDMQFRPQSSQKTASIKKRRNSFDATKSVSSSFQIELIKKLALVKKNDKFLMFIIFVRMFDQSNLEDSQVPKLRKLYIQFMDTQRIKKLAKPNSLTFKEEKKLKKEKKKPKKTKDQDLKSKFGDFEDCFNTIVKLIDDLAKVRKASCILRLSEISVKIQEIAVSYLEYMNKSTPDSPPFKYSKAYALSSFSASARQYAGNKDDPDAEIFNALLNKTAYLILKHCLLMSATDAFYVAFVWEQKLMTIFPILRQHSNIPYLNLSALDFIEKSFYKFLKKDPELLRKTQEIIRFLFK